jgi:hypothetical protein
MSNFNDVEIRATTIACVPDESFPSDGRGFR